MGQAQSAPQASTGGEENAASNNSTAPEGEDMLFELFNNTALVNYLIKQGKVGALAVEKEDDTSRYPLAQQEYAGTVLAPSGEYQASIKWEAGRYMWWRNLQQPGQVQDWTYNDVSGRLGKIMTHLSEESGSGVRLLKDKAIERRADFLSTLYTELHSKSGEHSERGFVDLDMARLLASLDNSSPEMSSGARISMSTSIKVVIALLEHNTKSSPILCSAILDIFLDALRQLGPLALSEQEVATTDEWRSYYRILIEGVDFVTKFLLDIVKDTNGPEGLDAAARVAFRGKAIEALIGLALTSGNLTTYLTVVDVLLKLINEKDASGKPVFETLNAAHWLHNAGNARDTLASRWDTSIPEDQPLAKQLLETFPVPDKAEEPLAPPRVLALMLYHLSALISGLVKSLQDGESKIADDGAAKKRNTALTFPYLVDVQKQTFVAIYDLLEVCTEHVRAAKTAETDKGKEKDEASNTMDKMYEFLLYSGLKLLKINLRQLAKNRITAKDVGLDWPTDENAEEKEKATAASLVSKLSNLLRAFINDPKSAEIFHEEVGNESCEALAVALDYFVPSQIDQAELLVTVCKEKAEVGKGLSSARSVFLQELLTQYSAPAVFDHLIARIDNEKERPVPQNFFSTILNLLAEISKQEFAEMINVQLLQKDDIAPASKRPAYVRFFLAIQNSAFTALSAERTKKMLEKKGQDQEEQTEEQIQLHKAQVARLQEYVIASLKHFTELLEILHTTVEKWIAQNHEERAAIEEGADPLERKKLETAKLGNTITWISKASVLALLSPMMSSLLFVDPFEIEQEPKKKTEAKPEEGEKKEESTEEHKAEQEGEKKPEEAATESKPTADKGKDHAEPAAGTTSTTTATTTSPAISASEPVKADKGKDKVDPKVDNEKLEAEAAEKAAKVEKHKAQVNNLLQGVRQVLHSIGKIHTILLGEGYNSLFGREYSQKLVTVVETLHPYNNDTDVDVSIVHPDAETITLEFDAQCATEDTHDYMFIYMAPDHQNQFGDKFTGPNGRFPTTPVLIPSGSAFLHFHSDVSNVDWGIKCTLTSEVMARSWIAELERTLLWISAKTAMDLLGTIDKKERRALPWLSSNLLRRGREQALPALTAGETTPAVEERNFLEDMIEKRGEAAKLHAKMTPNSLSASAGQFAQFNQPGLENAVRAVVAAILKHTELTGMAMRSANATRGTAMPAQLKKAYRYAYRIKKLLISQRQAQAKLDDGGKTYDELAEPIISKARLLLEFAPLCPSAQPKTNALSIVTPVSIRRSIGQLTAELKSDAAPTSIDQDDDEEDRKVDGPDATVWPWEPSVKAILAFVQSDISNEEIDSAIELRKHRATDREAGLVMLRQLLTVVPPSLYPDVLGFVSLALKGYSLAGRYLPDFHKTKKSKPTKMLTTLQHYSQDILGCGQEQQQSLSQAVYPLYKDLLALKSEDMSQTAIETNISLLETLAVRFQTESDFEFLKTVDIFTWLAPFLFDEKWNDAPSAKKDAKKAETKEGEKQGEKEGEKEQEKEKEKEEVPSSETPSSDADKPMPALVQDVASEPAKEGESAAPSSRPRSDSEIARELQASFDSGGDGGGLFGDDETPAPVAEEGQEAEEEEEADIFGLFGDDLFGSDPPEQNPSGNEYIRNDERRKKRKRAAQGLVRKRQWLVPESQRDAIPSDVDSGEDATGDLASLLAEPDAEEVRALLRGLLKRQRRAAWSLFQFLALQCYVPPATKADSDHEHEEEAAPEQAKLGEAQKALAVGSIEVLATALKRTVPIDAAGVEQVAGEETDDEKPILVTHGDTILFLSNVATSEVVREQLSRSEWVTLMFDVIQPNLNIRTLSRREGGFIAFLRAATSRIFAAILPQLSATDATAQEIVQYLIKQLGKDAVKFQLMLGNKGEKLNADDKGKGKVDDDDESKEEITVPGNLHCSQLLRPFVISALQKIAEKTAWKEFLTEWMVKVANDDLPEVVTQLTSLSNPIESASSEGVPEFLRRISDSITLLSLTGGFVQPPLPGTSVQLKAGSKKAGIVTGVKAGPVLNVSLPDEKWDYSIDPEKAVVDPSNTKEIANDVIARQLASLLPLFAKRPPAKNFVTSVLYYQLLRQLLQSLNSQVPHSPRLYQFVLENPELLKALITFGTEFIPDLAAKVKTIDRLERRLHKIELTLYDELSDSLTAPRNNVAATLVDVTGLSIDRCIQALEQSGDDKLLALSVLEEEVLQKPKPKDEPQGHDEMGEIAEAFLWNSSPYSEMTSKDKQFDLSTPPAAQPTWLRLINASKALCHRYALRILQTFLTDMQSKLLVDGTVPSDNEALLKAYNNLWSLVREKETLAKLSRAMLVARANKLDQATRKLVGGLVRNAYKTEVYTPRPVTSLYPGEFGAEPAKEEPKKVDPAEVSAAADATLARIMETAIVTLEKMKARQKKFKVQIEESAHPYPNDMDMEKLIELKGATSCLIVFDRECHTENNYDWVKFKDFKTKNIIRQISGEYANFTSFTIPSGKFYFQFTSDPSNNFWGYKFHVLGIQGPEPGEPSDVTDEALSTLEMAMQVAEASSVKEISFTDRTLAALMGSLRTGMNSATRIRVVNILRTFLRPSLWAHYKEKPSIGALLTYALTISQRIYSGHEEQLVQGQTLQSLTELILSILCLNNVRPGVAKIVGCGLGAGLEGAICAPAFEEDNHIWLQQPPLDHQKSGWTAMLWTQLPLRDVRKANTLLEFENGDKVSVEKQGDEFHIGLRKKDGDSFLTSGVVLPTTPTRDTGRSDAGVPELYWHFLSIKAIPETGVRVSMPTSSQPVGVINYYPVSSITAVGNSKDGGEQWGVIDSFKVVPGHETDEAIKSVQSQGAIRKDRAGPASINIDQSYKVSGEMQTSERNTVKAVKGFVTLCPPVTVKDGKWYYEITINSGGPTFLGWRPSNDFKAAGENEHSYAFNGSDPQVRKTKNETNAYGKRWKSGDVVGAMIDLTQGSTSITYSLNGDVFEHAYTDLPQGIAFSPVLTLEQGQNVTINFGAQPLAHLPEGYLPLDVTSLLTPEQASLQETMPYLPGWIRKVKELQDLMRIFLRRTPLPRSFIEEALHDREFLAFHPEANTISRDDHYFQQVKAMNTWTRPMDEQLVAAINSICLTKDYDPMEVSADEIKFSDSMKLQFPLVGNLDYSSLAARFYILRSLNRRFAALASFIDCSRMFQDGAVTPETINEERSLAGYLYAVRRLIFFGVKREMVRKICQQSNTSKDLKTFRLNRAKAIRSAADKASQGSRTMLAQWCQQLTDIDWEELRQSEKGWRTEFIGEGATDQGGPYRESLTQINTELHDSSLPMFIQCPNARVGVGSSRDKYVFNPSLTSAYWLGMFKAVGAITGICIRTKNVYDLRFPSLIWKHLVGDEDRNMEDLEGFDLITAQLVRKIEAIDDKEVWNFSFSDLTFTTTLSDGSKIELKRGGNTEIVTFDKRHEFCRLLVQARLTESRVQLEAFRKGLTEIIPVNILKMLSWQELETLVCGRPDFAVELLKNRTSYSGSLSATSAVIGRLWEVLTAFSPEDRGRFLRFVYGQSRLPPSEPGSSAELTIENLDRSGVSNDDLLPEAMTCSFKLKLPQYSSVAALRTKLLYAITHCAAIDTDYTPSSNWDAADLQTGEGEGESAGDNDSDAEDDEIPEEPSGTINLGTSTHEPVLEGAMFASRFVPLT